MHWPTALFLNSKPSPNPFLHFFNFSLKKCDFLDFYVSNTIGKYKCFAFGKSIYTYRIEDIVEEFDVYKRCRQLEKLIDELAKGRQLEKIKRTPK